MEIKRRGRRICRPRLFLGRRLALVSPSPVMVEEAHPLMRQAPAGQGRSERPISLIYCRGVPRLLRPSIIAIVA